MVETKTLSAVRSLIAKLNPHERVELAQWIIETAQPEKSVAAEQTTSPASTHRHNASRDVWRAKLRDEAAYWRTRPAQERTAYLGCDVAVHQHRVVDHDADLRALYLRVCKQFPATAVLLTAAEAHKPREFTIRNPQLERAVR